MARRKTYWTQKRLLELWGVFLTLEPDQLVVRFNRPFPDIAQAYNFELNTRRLKRQSRTETINGKTITIKCYAAEYAMGARSTDSWRSALAYL